MQVDETRAKWSEDKRQKIAILEKEHHGILEAMYGALMGRNNLAVKKLAPEVIQMQVQEVTTAVDLAALIDTLEAMGKIDRLDFMHRCVQRFRKAASVIHGSGHMPSQ